MKNSKLDSYNLREVILTYPNEIKKGEAFTKNIQLGNLLNKKFSNLIICGMGGSALPGELLINIQSNLSSFKVKIPVYLARTYSLPSTINDDSLIFINSYSGNTEETISCFKEALRKKLSIVAFSAGGEIEKISQANNIPHIKTKIDKTGFQPRYATPFVAVAMNNILTSLFLSDKIEGFPSLKVESFEKKGEQLAKKTIGKTPIIYSSERFKIASKIWKIKINENSKTPAFWNYFPELNHNEMVGFTNPQASFVFFMIKDAQDHSQTKQRIDITANLYRKKGLEVEIIKTTGKSYLEKLFNLMILGDWHSYYLAHNYKIDPTPVKMVEDLKKQLS